MGTEKGSAGTADGSMQLVHLLRALTVELDLLGGEFAGLHGLHPTDLRALIALLDAARAGTQLTPGRLGEQLHLNSAGTTALVDRLERLGLIRRVRDTGDRRRVLLVVEERAMELGQSFFGPLIGGMVAALGDFDAAELAAARRFLVTMAQVVAATREGPAGGAAVR
ncbi:MarR family winged helix-turn-helix transcriptional regulator [Saccharothrix sp. ST-888]|uniref:MarR family winged helix-turn-helix transcriptional regulator n=1 Tax=Saccharothrix sp. ST-888 TaxID=1427391 RepID=UPI0005EC9338|nr:MarR family transcriptional regulator [Saccharothrix sp. ST-888]KJK59254.1 MarR family transcriptional regulator [Saccharothrix sp. ST-888]